MWVYEAQNIFRKIHKNGYENICLSVFRFKREQRVGNYGRWKLIFIEGTH